MADRKATNKYYPPDWDPSKGSINKYVGQHPLRDRARKLDQGILIVRFELPYSIWCNGCNKSAATGVRYNAEKKTIGKYYSTPILSFRMKCHHCSSWFEIQTDPKNAAYKVMAGARRKTDDFAEAEDRGTLKIDTPEEFERRANDKFAKLEHSRLDQINTLRADATVLTKLQHISDRQWSDPYTLSQKLRKEFRKERAKIKSSEALADKIGVGFRILPESQEDAEATKLVEFDAGEKAVMMQRLKEIKSGGLFAAAKSAPKNQHQQKNWSRQLATTAAAGGSGVTGGRGGIGGLSKTSTLVASTGSSGSGSDKDRILRSLTSIVKANTQLQVDPFLNSGSGASSRSSSVVTASTPPSSSKSGLVSKPSPLVAYGDDDDDDDD
ncbi:hypothetical protein BG015_011916 [Linnemannia schmuckeri]|uniref:DUF572-domain-containing protein n=1 Tax=Linnemannia schmuckeri TaxID=64567 RepID=A0A9P5VDV3_9FUNG|nr:hypothetical protein BG015_011916 [Linnemannia schmuckeri]